MTPTPRRNFEQNQAIDDLQGSYAIIDEHIASGAIHFKEDEITITESQISDFGSYAIIGHTHIEEEITDLKDYFLNSSGAILETNLNNHTSSGAIHFTISEGDNINFNQVGNNIEISSTASGASVDGKTLVNSFLFSETTHPSIASGAITNLNVGDEIHIWGMGYIGTLRTLQLRIDGSSEFQAIADQNISLCTIFNATASTHIVDIYNTGGLVSASARILVEVFR